MPLFGGLKRNKSKQSVGDEEHQEGSQDPHGSIRKHLVHRTSSSSANADPPAVVNPQNSVAACRDSRKPHSLSRRSSSETSRQPQHSGEEPQSGDEVHRNAKRPHQLFQRSSSATSRQSNLSEAAPLQDRLAVVSGTVNIDKTKAPSSILGNVTRVGPDSTDYIFDTSTEANGLSKDDVHNLFSGAPHFLLEKGNHGKSFPQVFFPWDKHLQVADLVGRRWLEHESFALATLHAHLPVPDRLDWQPTLTRPYNKHEAWKRPAFELGIFELPNMLNIHGKEAGTVGMRHFLELPIADRFRAEKVHEAPRNPKPAIDFANMSSTEAFKALQDAEGSATIGKQAAWQDRLKLIQEGPKAWKRVGVREIDLQVLTARLARISSWHEEVVKAGWKMTVLCKQDSNDLYQELFTNFLFPQRHVTDATNPQSMKVQIEALLNVLTTPGAWIDLSLVSSRLHLGQMLWQATTQEGKDIGSARPAPGAERAWLLVQLLLSIELVIRLDAALRLGVSQHSAELHVSSYEIHHFNKIRTTKLDWDLVFARRFLDWFCVSQSSTHVSSEALPKASPTKHGLFSKGKRTTDNHDQGNEDKVWNCRILPRRPKQQLDGLLRFARFLEWPNFESFENRISQRLKQYYSAAPDAMEPCYGSPITCTTEVARNVQAWNSSAGGDGTKPAGERYAIWLQAATATHPGGWLSRSWLTGLVLPGEIACDLLISTLLENDPEVLKKLGPIALLHGGFVLDGRSWWSKCCVIGRVFAPHEGGTQCMGWISTPKLMLVDEHKAPLPNKWVDVEAADVPSLREKTRIHDDVKMAIESSPLGIGQGKVMGKEFLMPGNGFYNTIDHTTVKLEHVMLQSCRTKTNSKNTQAPVNETLAASAQFLMKRNNEESHSPISMEMKYDVYFITSHPCRLPPSVTTYFPAGKDQHLGHKHGEPLLSHPLHQSYLYAIKSVTDLLHDTPPNQVKRTEPTWVVDARGGPEKDIFIRAWCAQVGKNALVSRIGRTCLSCSIREARAIEVAIVIRVGVQD